jgi:Ricin-type beta-trefoil lectin domain
MRLSRRFTGPLAAGIMAAGAAVAAAAPASASTVTPYWHIMTIPQGFDHPLCLQGDLGGPLGSTVTQQNCDTTYTSASQLWQPVAVGGDIYKFENIGTGRCLEARNGAVNGGAVDLWPCESSESNERWAWDQFPTQDTFPGVLPIQTRVSGSTGYCLDVPWAQLTAGLQMQVYRCNGTAAQLMWISHPD